MACLNMVPVLGKMAKLQIPSLKEDVAKPIKMGHFCRFVQRKTNDLRRLATTLPWVLQHPLYLVKLTPSFSYFWKRAASTLFSAQTASRTRVPSRSMIVDLIVHGLVKTLGSSMVAS